MGCGLSVSTLRSGTIGPLINSKINMSISEDAVVGRMVTYVVLALFVLTNFLYFILQLVWILLIKEETVCFGFFRPILEGNICGFNLVRFLGA